MIFNECEDFLSERFQEFFKDFLLTDKAFSRFIRHSVSANRLWSHCHNVFHFHMRWNKIILMNTRDYGGKLYRNERFVKHKCEAVAMTSNYSYGVVFLFFFFVHLAKFNLWFSRMSCVSDPVRKTYSNFKWWNRTYRRDKCSYGSLQ